VAFTLFTDKAWFARVTCTFNIRVQMSIRLGSFRLDTKYYFQQM